LSDVGYKKAYVCLICGRYYDIEREVKDCVDSHLTYDFVPKWVIGSDMPSAVKVVMKKGEEVLKEYWYKLVKD